MERLSGLMMGKTYQIPNNYMIFQKDPLFWCFFVLKHGLALYEIPGVVCFLREKEEKNSLVKLIRDNKSFLQSHGIKNKDTELEMDLTVNQRISKKTFLALIIIHQMNIMFLENQKAYWWNETIDNVVRYYPNNNCVEILFGNDGLDLKETYFHWKNIERPLKACSSFKHEELLAMCEKMKLDLKKKTSKAGLYQLISESIL